VSHTADEIKSCCAAAYSSEAARFLLGDGFHPGGAALSGRLIGELGVGPGTTVIDVASGQGTSALQLARETGCDVIGVDLSLTGVAAAQSAAARAGLGERARFVVGDAEALPLPEASVDGALCECALCTFPDKPAAARELARVLKPGARLALSDVTAEPERLPEELRKLPAWVACIGGARPLEEIASLLTAGGFVIEQTERHDRALAELLEQVEVRLRAARLLLGDGLEQAFSLLALARDAAEHGALGYASVVARR
jgi:hypothetical protein